MKSLFTPDTMLATVVLGVLFLGAGQIASAATPDTTQADASKNMQKSVKQIQKSIKMGSVTVTADLYHALQNLKVALKRPESSDPADANLLVCRVRQGLGTHFNVISCATNRSMQLRRERSQISWINAVDVLRFASPGDHAATAIQDLKSLKTGFEFPAGSRLMHLIHTVPAPTGNQTAK